MHTTDAVLAAQRVVWVLSLCAQTLLIGALVHRKLLRSYPFFFAFLVIDLGCSLALIQIRYLSLAYAATFRICQIEDAVFELIIAGELLQRLCCHFRQFPGMGRFRFVMVTALVMITGVFFLVILPGVPAPYPHLVIVWVERWETSVLAITVALFWWVLTRFLGLRPPMRSNAVAHGVILTSYFAIRAVGYAIVLPMVQDVDLVHLVNVALLSGYLACDLAWLIYLRKDGEELPPEPPISAEALEFSRFWRRKILEYVQQAGR